MIPVSAGAKIWIATGHTDMRKGMQDLALLVQEGLGRDPSAGDVIVFRGRAGTLIKAFGTTGSGCRSTPKDWRAGEPSSSIASSILATRSVAHSTIGYFSAINFERCDP